jgi:hypothetical protein
MWFFLLVFKLYAATPECFENVQTNTLQYLEKNQILEKEILTRLIFAEGISTNYFAHEDCREKGSHIFEAIAWGVMSRVRMSEHDKSWAHKYGKGIKGVIFKKNQFNPAISLKSRFHHLFMCPSLDGQFKKHWQWAQAAANTAMNNSAHSPFIQSKWEKENSVSLVSHFYYPLSTQATKSYPDWADRKKNRRYICSRVKNS